MVLRWTQEENDYLTRHYPSMETLDIANHLGRSQKAIHLHAHQRGIKKLTLKTIEDIELTDAEAGYIAGCLDCDGCIGLWGKKGTTKYDPCVVFYNNNKDLVDKLKQMIGFGSIYPTTHKNRNHKTGWTYKISNTQTYPLLKRLLPYLVRKRKQANLIHQFYELRWSKEYNASYGKEEREMIEKIKLLNQGGRNV